MIWFDLGAKKVFRKFYSNESPALVVKVRWRGRRCRLPSLFDEIKAFPLVLSL